MERYEFVLSLLKVLAAILDSTYEFGREIKKSEKERENNFFGGKHIHTKLTTTVN